MTTATAIASTGSIGDPPNLDDLVERLGGITLSRILVDPAPGTATETDVLEAQRRFNRLYELVDGVLVEKVMGFTESLLGKCVIQIGFTNSVFPEEPCNVDPDGSVRLFPGLIRIPDVAFASWDRFPERRIPEEAIPSLAPDLVIEVLSESNTGPEMQRKRNEYFRAGVRLIWEFDPEARVVVVYTPDGSVTRLGASQALDGGVVLPGFVVQIGEIFSELDRHG